MAFEFSVLGKDLVWGSKRISFGTYTNGATDTGGDINTGLGSCELLFLQPSGATVIANAPVVNETLPIDGSAVTIVTTADEDGYWLAVGKS